MNNMQEKSSMAAIMERTSRRHTSWSGLNLNIAKISGHKGPLELGRYISPSSEQILTCDGNKDCF